MQNPTNVRRNPFMLFSLKVIWKRTQKCFSGLFWTMTWSMMDRSLFRSKFNLVNLYTTMSTLNIQEQQNWRYKYIVAQVLYMDWSASCFFIRVNGLQNPMHCHLKSFSWKAHQFVSIREELFGVTCHLKRLVITEEGVPVMSHVEFFIIFSWKCQYIYKWINNKGNFMIAVQNVWISARNADLRC